MVDYLIGSLYVLFVGLIVGDIANASLWSETGIARSAIWKEYQLKAPDFDGKKHLAYVAVIRNRGAIMIAMSITMFMRIYASAGTMLLSTVMILSQYGPIQLHSGMMVHQLIALLLGYLYRNVVEIFVAQKMEEQGSDVIQESAANLNRELGRIPAIAEIMAETIEVFRTDLVWQMVQEGRPFYRQWINFWIVRLGRIVYLAYVAWLLWPLVQNV